ncbi:FGGY-family carbohydrate kinase [Chelativorans intermedius]|uniref:FGGY-family carbohydrate kinase n=1 Tax=Chelativorans intermedius TaxID=515947 RepID=A0ABV6DCN9_9HYPH|nr:FGGY-family carbohydrate kinase [Chelativorans intermedius]MCT9000434.1 carbohydrate kinase [Chelativorans intermedius]
MPSLLGLDSGLTVTKAVLFDSDGTEIAVARRRVPQHIPRPRHVERDMDGLWSAAAEAIAAAIAQSGRPASDIAAVAATAHGDGIYLLDADRKPLGAGILSLDSRAEGLVADWSRTDLFGRALKLTGQTPHAAAPSALLAWIAREEPERFGRIAHILACKDWLRFCLTGTIGTDRTEASTAFTRLATQDYTTDALELFGLEALAAALPAIDPPAAVVGRVTEAAARQTGLVAGTPVAAGLHDVTASALGIGGHRPGVVDVVAGTYSINEIVSDRPRTDPRWFCRSGIEPGTWNSMSISPASTTNYDWFLETLCRAEAGAADSSIHERLAPEISQALKRRSTLLFHPFLFGSPHGANASGAFLGMHGWHDRGDLLRAVLEGIAFNHRYHVDALRDGFPFEAARLTGGVSRSPDFAQMMADVLGVPVSTSRTGEAAAWGAALCAGAAVGLFKTPFDDPRDLDALSRTYSPDTDRHADYNRRYAVFAEAVEALRPVWRKLEALGSETKA